MKTLLGRIQYVQKVIVFDTCILTFQVEQISVDGGHFYEKISILTFGR